MSESNLNTKMEADVRVANHGTILLFTPLTTRARAVFAEKLPMGSDHAYVGDSAIVEARYARDLARNLVDIDGLTLV